ncbi:MAG: methyltransferase [Lachnospiraceae bacterium]|nr:methyltransferase [Lachnospiraceae bacterium]
MIKSFLKQIEQKEDVRKALSELRAAIKESDKQKELRELIGEGDILLSLLSDDDPKVRKNAAALLGDLQLENTAKALYEAYQVEDTLFVRSILLKALGNTNAYPYLSELKERYDALCAVMPQENEKKHIQEELRALEKILRDEGKDSSHTFTGWNEKVTVILTTNPDYREITAKELQEKHLAYRIALSSIGVTAWIDDLRQITQIRTFRELLFPIKLGQTITKKDKPELLGKALAASNLLPLLKKCHKEDEPFYFRMELRNGMDLEERSRYTKKAAFAIEEGSNRQLLNSTEQYEFEIRILANKEGEFRAFLKMNTIPMDRFDYRKETIAASIHPSSAAMLMQLAKPYLKERAQILDPCCGVGTMLAERHKLLPAREIYGIDIFGEAIEKAKVNCELAGMHVNFIHRDYLDFKHGYLFDEIIANMPVRGKKTKEEQDMFYEAFFRKSEELLAPKGVLILYSNETGFIKKQLRLHPKLRLQQEYIIRKKDQFALYIIGLREK